MSPSEVPIGQLVSATAKVLSREFDAALAAVGGSRPTWLVLLSLKTAWHRTQGELAEAVGIPQPTLSHHLARPQPSPGRPRGGGAGPPRPDSGQPPGPPRHCDGSR